MYVCILDASGHVLAHCNLQPTPDAFLEVVALYREDLVVAAECMFAWYFADVCAAEGIDFVLGHALAMKAIHGAKARMTRLTRRRSRRYSAAVCCRRRMCIRQRCGLRAISFGDGRTWCGSAASSSRTSEHGGPLRQMRKRDSVSTHKRPAMCSVVSKPANLTATCRTRGNVCSPSSRDVLHTSRPIRCAVRG